MLKLGSICSWNSYQWTFIAHFLWNIFFKVEIKTQEQWDELLTKEGLIGLYKVYSTICYIFNQV